MRLSASTVSTLPRIGKSVSHSESHQIKTSVQCRSWKGGKRVLPVAKGMNLGFCLPQSRRTIRHGDLVVSASLNAKCAVAETQTMTRKSSSATVVSPPGKETLPMLDDGGSGFRGIGYTPYYRGDGRGGGGGGGGGGFPTSGDFPWGDYWFYIFLFLLRFLIMNIMGEGPCVYKYEDGRNKPIRRYV